MMANIVKGSNLINKRSVNLLSAEKCYEKIISNLTEHSFSKISN